MRKFIYFVLCILILVMFTNCYLFKSYIPTDDLTFNGYFSLEESYNLENINSIFKFKDIDYLNLVKNWNETQQTRQIKYSLDFKTLWVQFQIIENKQYQIFLNGNNSNGVSLKKNYNIISENDNVDILIAFNSYYNDKRLDYGIYYQSDQFWNLKTRNFTFIKQENNTVTVGIPISELNGLEFITNLLLVEMNNKNKLLTVISETKLNLNSISNIEVINQTQELLLNPINLNDNKNLSFLPLDAEREFYVYLESNDKLIIQTNNLLSGQDTIIKLYDSNYNLLSENDDFNEILFDSQLEYDIFDSGFYYVKVSQWNNRYIGYYNLDTFILNEKSILYQVTLFEDGFENGSMNPNWMKAGTLPFVQSNTKYSGSYALQFGKPAQNQKSIIQVNVKLTNTGIVQFKYRTSSEYSYDTLDFYVDEKLVGRWSGDMPFFSHFEYKFKAQGNYTLKWEYVKDGNIESYNDTQWLDSVIVQDDYTPPIVVVETINENFETGNITKYPWIVGGNVYPYLQTNNKYDGNYQIKFGTIKDSQRSTIQITVNVKNQSILSYWYKVSSETERDFFILRVDGYTKQQFSGNMSNFQQQSFVITPGQHTILFEYYKNSSLSTNQDTQWLDNIQLFVPILPQPFNYILPEFGSTVQNNINIPFSWSSSAYQTCYEFYIGVNSVMLTNYQTVTNTNYTYPLRLTPNTVYYWKIIQKNSYGSYNGSVQQFQTKQETFQNPYTLNENFETGNLLKYNWLFGGSGIPIVQSTYKYEENYQVKLGNIPNSQDTYIAITVYPTQTSTLNFYYKIDSESNCDFMKFYVNNVLIKSDSGIKSWQLYSYELLPNISYTLKWMYSKDGSINYGTDALYLDLITVSLKAQEPFSTVDKIGPLYSGNILLISNYSTNITNLQTSGNILNIIEEETVTINLNEQKEIYPINIVRDLPENHRSLNIVESTYSGERQITKLFWAYNFQTNKDYQFTQILQYTGNYCEIWVESTADITVSLQQQLQNEFDSNIYGKVSQNFHIPSDVDNNGKTQILCYNILDGFSGAGGYIQGYFWGGDLLTMSISNKMEMINIDTYPGMKSSLSQVQTVSRQYSTVQHEFQHLVNFNRNYLIENSHSEMNIALNEGLSMQQEHLIYGGLSSRISYYNSYSTNSQSVLDWKQTLYSYSLSYLFMQYIRTQTTIDASIYNKLIIDELNDMRVVDKYIKQYSNNIINLQELTLNFRIQLLLKEQTGSYGFKGEPQFSGISPSYTTQNNVTLYGGGQVYKMKTNFQENGSQDSNIRFVGITK